MASSMTDETDKYPLLSSADADVVRKRLGADQEHFYHFTLDTNLQSIAAEGLHPRFVSPASQYAACREPAHAMRFCLRSSLPLGLSAANTRNQYWDDRAFLWLPKSSKVVLIRTPAASLLNRSFGLDHSFGDADHEVTRLLGDSRQQLTPDEFTGVVVTFGAISSYEPIPPSELEVCLNPREFCSSLAGIFLPLLK
jgi:hypothetical protein